MCRISKQDFSILIGNALDHFDMALYGLLVPVIAPLFFPQFDQVVQLILGYSLFFTSLFTKPIGIILFSLMAENKGAPHALSLSLIGVAILVVIMGCLPTYSQAGIFAPISLILVRILLDIFSSGESSIAKIYILEGKSHDSAKIASYIYQTSSMVGAVLSSILVALIVSQENPALYWRFPFLMGGLTAVWGVYLRNNLKKEARLIIRPFYSDLIFSNIWKQRKRILLIAAATSFGYVTYTIPFIFMNSFIPLVTNISLNEMMQLNTALLVFDMVAIIVIGHLIRKYSPTQVMSIASIILSITIIPLFYGIKDASLLYVTMVRFWIVVIGVAFACYLNIWSMEQFSSGNKYLYIGIGSIIGGATLGKLTPSICLILWKVTGEAYAPAYYITFVSVLTVVALVLSKGVRTAKVESREERHLA